MKILFWLRKAKQNKVGTCPVYCRITIEGLRSPDFSTSVRVFPQDWDAKNQKIKGNTTETQLANATLNEIRNRLHLLYLDLSSKQKPFTARTIYELYHHKIVDVSLRNCIEGYFQDVVRVILERYGYKLPVLSNQRYNGYLKELSDLCGIRKRLTTHVARKTFCVMALNDWGLPVETVQVLAGHKKLHTTMQYYTRVLERKISNDMAKIE